MREPGQQEFAFGQTPDGPSKKRRPRRTGDPAPKRTRARPAPASTAAPANPARRPPVAGSGGPLQALMDDNFLQFASYVIRERAIPSLHDGLKPVQRRILHALHETDDGRLTKVANVVGHTMRYHPHGDASIGDALVAMVNRGSLIEGQGNFGNIFTGDPAAAPRYIECRLTDLARREVFNKDLTRYAPSYDGRNMEPVELPCKLPLLLMLGAEGIAVGISTRILPHNFRELVEAQIAIVSGKPFKVLPDFAHGGLMDASAYGDGQGSIRVRARIEPRGEGHLAIRELPPGTTTETIIASIEDAIQRKRVPVKSITDFTAEHVEIDLALAPGTRPSAAVKALYAFTACESTLSSHLVAIRDGKPVELTVSETLRILTARLTGLLKAELELQRRRLMETVHNRTLVQLFVEERLYKLIETCKTADKVRRAVLDGLAPFRERLHRDVSREDVEMLLGIPIRRISLFDIERNRRDITDALDELRTVDKHLKDLKRYTLAYLRGLLKTYGEAHPRRTEATRFDAIEVRKLTARELTICYDREKGYLGHDVEGETLLECSSLDKLLLVWNNGRYKVITPPEKWFADTNLIEASLPDRDRVITMVYALDGFTYLKRFTFGGTILNKDYLCTPGEAEVLLFETGTPETLYVKYRPAKGQRIHQQTFHPADVPVRSARARGNQMTAKRVARIAASRPRWWKDDNGPRGRLL